MQWCVTTYVVGISSKCAHSCMRIQRACFGFWHQQHWKCRNSNGSPQQPFAQQTQPWAVLCWAVLCCAVLCWAVLCCAVLCCAVLCCAVLCCAVLYRAKHNSCGRLITSFSTPACKLQGLHAEPTAKVSDTAILVDCYGVCHSVCVSVQGCAEKAGMIIQYLQLSYSSSGGAWRYLLRWLLL